MERDYLRMLDRISWMIRITVFLSVGLPLLMLIFLNKRGSDSHLVQTSEPASDGWRAPDLAAAALASRPVIEYGKDLIEHTSRYFGPEGLKGNMSNGLNCQNCHLEAGAKPFANNYGAVASSYPKFRARSGTIETVEKRVNDCFERSLNGKPLDSASSDMQAIVAYIRFVGSNVSTSGIPAGVGMEKIGVLDRAADPERGEGLYQQQCASCHGADGAGQIQSGSKEFTFPPLWGNHSYNVGAGMYRVSNLAAFIRSNMPLGATRDHPMVTEEDAWDIAAFVNSMPHPEKDISKDWPTLASKPFDHPFGPFADPFPAQQHKYGPFKPIIEYYSKK